MMVHPLVYHLTTQGGAARTGARDASGTAGGMDVETNSERDGGGGGGSDMGNGGRTSARERGDRAESSSSRGGRRCVLLIVFIFLFFFIKFKPSTRLGLFSST